MAGASLARYSSRKRTGSLALTRSVTANSDERASTGVRISTSSPRARMTARGRTPTKL
jgi:hypothetical protein